MRTEKKARHGALWLLCFVFKTKQTGKSGPVVERGTTLAQSAKEGKSKQDERRRGNLRDAACRVPEQLLALCPPSHSPSLPQAPLTGFSVFCVAKKGAAAMLHGLLSGSVSHVPLSDLDQLLRLRLSHDRPQDPVSTASGASLRLVFARRVASRLLQDKGTKEGDDGEVLMSTAELATRKTALELVVAWWLAPLLEEGVGPPLRFRAAQTKQTEKPHFESQEEERESLWNVACVMLKLLREPFVSSLLRENHLGDLFGALLQLGWAPHSRDSQLGANSRAIMSKMIAPGGLQIDSAQQALFQHIAPRRSPPWLSAAAGSLLSAIMTRPNGICSFLTQLCENDRIATDFESVAPKAAMIIAMLPRGVTEKSDCNAHFANVSRQLSHILKTETKNEAVRRCVALAVAQLWRKEPAIVRESFFCDMVAPLCTCECASEVTVDCAVQNLLLLTTPLGAGGGETSAEFWLSFRECCVRIVFELGCAVVGTASRLSSPVAELIASSVFLPNCAAVRNALMEEMVLGKHISDTVARQFALGSTGGATMAMMTRGNDARPRDLERESALFAHVALKRAPAGVAGDVFAEAMHFLTMVGENDVSVSVLNRRSLMLHIADELVSDAALLKDAFQVLVVLRSILLAENLSDTVAQLCVGMLAELVPHLRGLQKHEETLLSDLVPLLQQLGSRDSEFTRNCGELIDAINSVLRSAIPAHVSQNDDDSSFSSVLRDIGDPLLPVRAHALVALRKLVLLRDQETMSQFSKVVSIFSTLLRSDDSYVYLGAIAGLAALGDVAPQSIISPMLREMSDSTLALDTRLKLAEAAVSIARRLGEMLPVYSPQFLDAFFRAIAQKDCEQEMRASCLACVGAMCEVLHFSLADVICEIILCLNGVLTAEEEKKKNSNDSGEIIVRRAAAGVSVLLIRGAGKKKLYEMAGLQMRDLTNRLRIISISESDQIVRGHAALALQELESEFF